MGDFPVAKWNSNSSEFLKKFLAEPPAEEAVPLDDCATNILKMKWLPHSDKFTFKMNLPLKQEIVTKRIILSEISKLYNPIEIISPVIITSKYLLQELWLHKLTWDELLPNSIVKKWLHIREDLTNLDTISIPRWLGIQEELVNGSSWFFGCFTTGGGRSSLHQVYITHRWINVILSHIKD